MIKPQNNKLAPLILADDNLSFAWARAFMHAMTHPGSKISPLIISITAFDENGAPQEDPMIRSALDIFLSKHPRMNSVKVTAFTIFPQQYWAIARGNRQDFYRICFDAIPRIKRRDSRNRKGIYFERLFQFGPKPCPCDGNQIEFIIENYRKGVRASMMQAVTFDPARDQSRTALLGFPCLQSVSFVATEAGLVVNATYPTQYLVERAYGNFLGISQLGAFVAQNIGLRLAQVNIFAGVESLVLTKEKLAKLAASVTKALPKNITAADGPAAA